MPLVFASCWRPRLYLPGIDAKIKTDKTASGLQTGLKFTIIPVQRSLLILAIFLVAIA